MSQLIYVGNWYLDYAKLFKLNGLYKINGYIWKYEKNRLYFFYLLIFANYFFNFGFLLILNLVKLILKIKIKLFN